MVGPLTEGQRLCYIIVLSGKCSHGKLSGINWMCMLKQTLLSGKGSVTDAIVDEKWRGCVQKAECWMK